MISFYKHLFTIHLFLAICCAPTFGQGLGNNVVSDTTTVVLDSISKPRIRAGFRGGVNVANNRMTPDISTGPRIGGFGGGAIEMEFMKPVYLQVEPQYIQKGIVSAYSVGGFDVEEVYKLDYISFPINYKAIIDIGGANTYFLAGADIGFLASARVQYQVPEESITIDTIDVSNGLEKFDFALDFGIGVELELTPTIALTSDLRYAVGMTNSFILFGSNDDRVWKSRDLKFSVGLMFVIQDSGFYVYERTVPTVAAETSMPLDQ